MRMTLHITLLLILLAFSSGARASEYVAMSGQELYVRFCASCHGVTGRGDGPVAGSLKVEVPDLTLIARRAKGAYARDRIEKIIDGRHIVAAHGSRTMPVWGEDFSRLELGNPDAERSTRVIILRLADYVWLLQQPSAQDLSRTLEPLSHDSDDRAIQLENDESLQAISQAAISELEDIDVALDRIARGSYGICRTCGHKISAARLAAVPQATICQRCGKA
jgi:RNA polymerase-binding transcription factor DksA/mono/diheme cytochrome c family protein